MKSIKFQSSHDSEFQESGANKDAWISGFTGARKYQDRINTTYSLLLAIPAIVSIVGMQVTEGLTQSVFKGILLVAIVAWAIRSAYEIFKGQNYFQLLWKERKAVRGGPAQSIEELKNRDKDD